MFSYFSTNILVVAFLRRGPIYLKLLSILVMYAFFRAHVILTLIVCVCVCVCGWGGGREGGSVMF